MARILDGKALAAKVRSEVAKELKDLQQSNSKFKPHLTIVQVCTLRTWLDSYFNMTKVLDLCVCRRLGVMKILMCISA